MTAVSLAIIHLLRLGAGHVLVIPVEVLRTVMLRQGAALARTTSKVSAVKGASQVSSIWMQPIPGVVCPAFVLVTHQYVRTQMATACTP